MLQVFLLVLVFVDPHVLQDVHVHEDLQLEEVISSEMGDLLNEGLLSCSSDGEADEVSDFNVLDAGKGVELEREV